MLPIDSGEIRGLIEGAVTAISILGGGMALSSGYGAAKAMSEDQPPAVISERINEGVGKGFSWGLSLAIPVFIILLWI